MYAFHLHFYCFQVIVYFFRVDTAAPNERLQISLSFHIICKYLGIKCYRKVPHIFETNIM